MLIALQLVGGKGFKSKLFEDEMHTLQTFDFRTIEKKISKYVPGAKRTFDKISKKIFKESRHTGGGLVEISTVPTP